MASNDTLRSDIVDEEEDKGSTEWPFHPRNKPKIGRVVVIGGYRQQGEQLQFRVSEDGVNFDWMNSTDFQAPDKVRQFWSRLVEHEGREKLKPKPYKLMIRQKEHYVESDSYRPRVILAELKQAEDELYLVEDETGRRLIVDRESIKQKHYHLVREYWRKWTPVGEQ